LYRLHLVPWEPLELGRTVSRRRVKNVKNYLLNRRAVATRSGETARRRNSFFFIVRRTTERGARRLCVRFDSRPEQDILQILKANSGRFRKAGSGDPSCWYIPEANGAALVAALGPHPLAALLATLLGDDQQPPAQTQAVPVVMAEGIVAPGAAVPSSAEAEEEPGCQRGAGGRPRKRQRRSLRTEPGSCLACLWQIRMLGHTGRYHEPGFPHDEGCGF